MGKLPGHARSAYSGTIDISTGCTSTLPRGTLSKCRSDTPILGSGHMQLYPLDTVPTHPHRALGLAACGSTHGEFSPCMYHWRTT